VSGVHAVSLSWDAVPMSGDDDEQLFWLQNEPKPADTNDMHWALRYVVEPDYLKIMRIPLLRGRFFTDSDREGSPPVAVIDEDLARRYFGDADPLGKLLNFEDSDRKVTIVGVVGHIMQWNLDNDAGLPLRAQIYLPFAQLPGSDLVSTTGISSDILLRADHPDTIFHDIQSALRRINNEQVAYLPRTMNQMIATTFAEKRFSMILLGAFAALALLLATVGLYGVIAYFVNQRRHEMAIRMALGADRRNVLLWVLKRGTALAVVGAAIGTLAALLLTQLMSTASMLYGVRPYDPPTIIGVVALLIFVALAASYLPARRAASIDPMKVLRAE
jgi:predicted permease